MERASFSKSLLSIPAADLLDQGDVGFIDVDDKILVLVGEQVLHDVVGGDVRCERTMRISSTTRLTSLLKRSSRALR